MTARQCGLALGAHAVEDKVRVGVKRPLSRKQFTATADEGVLRSRGQITQPEFGGLAAEFRDVFRGEPVDHPGVVFFLKEDGDEPVVKLQLTTAEGLAAKGWAQRTEHLWNRNARSG